MVTFVSELIKFLCMRDRNKKGVCDQSHGPRVAVHVSDFLVPLVKNILFSCEFPLTCFWKIKKKKSQISYQVTWVRIDVFKSAHILFYILLLLH